MTTLVFTAVFYVYCKNIVQNNNKHTYKMSIDINGNTIVIPCEGTVLVSRRISDELNSAYQMVMYTTIKPIEQISFDKVEKTVKPGKSIKLNATAIDSNDNIIWSVPEATGKAGTIDANGTYTADPDAHPGDMIAVKAAFEHNSNAYGISIIRIK